MTKHQNRTLGAFETTFWLLDQIDSKDFALAAEKNQLRFGNWLSTRFSNDISTFR